MRHLRIISLGAIGGLLLVTGCAVGPDYERPEVLLPAEYTELDGLSSEMPQPIIATWWHLFNDPVMNQLVDQAIRHNAELAQAVARIEEAEAVVRQAQSAFYPQLGLEGSAGRRQISVETSTLPSGVERIGNAFSATVSTAFELDFWGRLRRASEAARAQLLASQFGRHTVQLALVSNVAQSYLALRSLDAQIAVSRETLASRENTKDLVQRRAQAGVASPLEVQQAEIVRAAAAAQLSELVRQRALVAHQLGVLTGDMSLQVETSDLRALPIPPVPPPGLPSMLLNARPDIRQAEAQLISANALIGVAKAEFFPRISLTGSFGGESRELSDLFSSPARIWSLGAALDLPLFDAGRRTARVDEATARQQQALAAYIQSVRIGFQEVNDALVSLRQTAITEEALESQMAAASEALRLAQTRYESGYSGFLEVLDAQRSANDAKLEFIRNRQQRLTATIGLFNALGGGWNSVVVEDEETAAEGGLSTEERGS